MTENTKNNLKNLNKSEYHKNVIKTWTWKGYAKYKNSPWRWADLPFADYITDNNYLVKEYLHYPVTKKIDNKSILEIGSAMGSAYEFLKETQLCDTSKYTGIEVSKMGYDYCVKNYPEANWLHRDFTQIKVLKKYDYIFERNAIHHMPNPLEAYKKIFKSTNISFSTCFRSCLKGKTISDLKLANFKTDNGVYYASITNLFDLLELALKEGFGSIKVTFGGMHEKISNKPESNFYLNPKINQNKIFLSRCRVRMIKTKLKKPSITFIARPAIIFKNLRAVVLIYLELKRIKKKYSS